MRHYLLVDDNRAFAENLAEIIRDLGDEVEVAASGAEALELVRARKFDAMLTDMRMPVMGGAELIARLRSDPETASIPIVAVSAERESASQVADAVVTKPFGPRGLLESVHSLAAAGA